MYTIHVRKFHEIGSLKKVHFPIGMFNNHKLEGNIDFSLTLCSGAINNSIVIAYGLFRNVHQQMKPS